jgi:hypothetical protein
MYLQYLVLLTQVAAGWCPVCDTPADSNLGEYYQILDIQSSAPDDRRKHRPKHGEVTRNNKLIYIVHLVGYFHNFFRLGKLKVT